MNSSERIKKVVNFLNSSNGIVFLSIVWALGIAAMCRGICEGRTCYRVKAYKMSNILKSNFRDSDGKCYKYSPYPYKCP